MISVLILGGYGTFGGRLAQLLADAPRLRLIIAGRSLSRAQAFAARLSAAAAAKIEPQDFDRDGDVELALKAMAPDVVVDASGPFQEYAGDPYRVVKAAIALRIHYLDLSDGAAFVTGIASFDEAARRSGVFVLSGVSSCPVLTAAVVRRLAADLGRVDSITAGIAPSPYARVGRNVVRAIASYAGRPVALRRDGQPSTAYALIDSRHFTIAPPGRVPLPRIRFTLVEVPELAVLPGLWPELRAVWFGTGPTPAIWHRLLSGCAWLVRLRLMRSLAPFATLMHMTMNRLSFGEHRGGMFVTVTGRTAAGDAVERSWHMLAEGDDGPFIPSMAAAAIIRRVIAGHPPAAGARAAVNDVELADYEAAFARRQISTGVRQSPPAVASLYRRILGDAYESLPPAVQVLHDVGRERTASGLATVARGTGRLSRLIGWVAGFPAAGENVAVSVTFRAENGREVWQRRFADRTFSSLQEEGRGRSERLLCERFGPFTFAMAVVVDGGRLQLNLRRWSVMGVPLPLALGPRSKAIESEEDGRYRFDVDIAHRLTGLIVSYRGWLVSRSSPQNAADC